MQTGNTLYIATSSTDWRARRLHNNYGSFTLSLDGESQYFPSVTQFMEMIKHPEHLGWEHLDGTALTFDTTQEMVVEKEKDQDRSLFLVGYMHGRPYNPVVYHMNKPLNRRELLKHCSPSAVQKIASRLHSGRIVVYLFGKIYQYGSSEHINLIELAIRAKFSQNDRDIKALLATEGISLVYIPRCKKDSTLFPAARFCKLLTTIRDEGIAKRDAYRNCNKMLPVEE